MRFQLKFFSCPAFRGANEFHAIFRSAKKKFASQACKMASRGTQCGNPKWIPRPIVSPLLCPCLEIKTPQNAHAFIECSRDAGLEYISCGTWMRIMKGICLSCLQYESFNYSYHTSLPISSAPKSSR